MRMYYIVQCNNGSPPWTCSLAPLSPWAWNLSLYSICDCPTEKSLGIKSPADLHALLHFAAGAVPP
jgi:hypothetical protein